MDELRKSTTGVVENIASDEDVKKNMDQMMMGFSKVCEQIFAIEVSFFLVHNRTDIVEEFLH